MNTRGFIGCLAALWLGVCVVALATWFVDPILQHVLQFMCGGAWGAAIVVLFVRSREDTGRRVAPWLVAMSAPPVAVLIMFGVAITWEVFSPIGVVVSTPLRLLEVGLAFALGRLGRGPETGGAIA